MTLVVFTGCLAFLALSYLLGRVLTAPRWPEDRTPYHMNPHSRSTPMYYRPDRKRR